MSEAIAPRALRLDDDGDFLFIEREAVTGWWRIDRISFGTGARLYATAPGDADDAWTARATQTYIELAATTATTSAAEAIAPRSLRVDDDGDFCYIERETPAGSWRIDRINFATGARLYATGIGDGLADAAWIARTTQTYGEFEPSTPTTTVATAPVATARGSTVADIVSQALRIAGALEEGEAPSAATMEMGRRSLQSMIRTWAAKRRLWLLETVSLDIVAAQTRYNLAARVLAIEHARYRRDSYDRQLRIDSRQEYDQLPSKAAVGEPVVIYFDQQIAATEFLIWPTPASSNDASIRLTVRREAADLDVGADGVSLPTEWSEAAEWGLAARLCPALQLPTDPSVAARASELYREIQGSSRAQSIFIRSFTGHW